MAEDDDDLDMRRATWVDWGGRERRCADGWLRMFDGPPAVGNGKADFPAIAARQAPGYGIGILIVSVGLQPEPGTAQEEL